MAASACGYEQGFEELDRPAAACHNALDIYHTQNGRTSEYQCTRVMISQMEGEIQPCCREPKSQSSIRIA